MINVKSNTVEIKIMRVRADDEFCSRPDGAEDQLLYQGNEKLLLS